jgi:DNA-binding transcriptional MerR regulator
MAQTFLVAGLLVGPDMRNQFANGARDLYSIAEVQEITGLSPRTVRFYISEGLIPPAHGRGPSATYDHSQLQRLTLIQQLKADHLPLDEIKKRLDILSDRQVASIVQADSRPAGESWQRIALHPDIELHVRSKSMPESQELDETVSLILEYVKPLVERMSRRQNGR